MTIDDKKELRYKLKAEKKAKEEAKKERNAKLQNQINKRFGDFITHCIAEREYELRDSGVLKGRRGISLRSLAEQFL
jgi:hypothetical protein